MSRRSILVRWAIVAGVIALAGIGSLSWWLARSPQAAQIPERVCNGHVSGSTVAKLFAEKSETFTESADRFPVESRHDTRVTCALRLGEQDVSIRVEYPAGLPPKKNVEADEPHFAHLGQAYGYYSELGGTLLTTLPCPQPRWPKDTIRVVTGADATQRTSRWDEPVAPGMVDALADLSAEATRVAAKVFGCPGAGQLPDGPVNVRN